MSWLSLPWSRNAKSRPIRKAPPRFRPGVEILEERITLNNRFVVPAGAAIDNVTNFATLQAALSTSGLASGNVIQIEPGSSPGVIAGLTLPNVQNLTIQGDPAAGLASTPQFTVSDLSFTISPAQAGFTFRGVNIGLIGSGQLFFNANGTITGSNIVDINSSAITAITFEATIDVMTNSTVVNQTVGGGYLLDMVPSNGHNNLIAGNSFLNLAANTNGGDLEYTAGSPVSVTDKLVGNSFLSAAGTSLSEAVFLNASVVGLTIQGNTFSGPMAVGVENYLSAPQGLLIAGNSFNITGSLPSGIELTAFNSGTTITATIVGNVVATNTGIGLLLNVGSGTLNAVVRGNDFHGNLQAVSVLGTGTANGIDLGGGSLGSIGGNNFRGYAAGSGAINTGVNVTGTISAQHNIFSVANPSTVTFSAHATIDTSNPLTGTTAFVETLYIDFLHRAGSAAELQSWVSSGLNQSQIVNAILRSTESLTNQVDALYLKILGRQADSGGQTGFVQLLQNGGTLEQVETGLFASAEYAALTGSDGAFIQSLYNKVLGRAGDNAGVAGWLNALPSIGRAAVANAFLHSAEARGDAVEQLYGDPLATPIAVASVLSDLLHRTAPPSNAEIASWVNSGLDLLSLEAALAGSGEFFSNG